MSERDYGTPGLEVRAVLRVGFRKGSGAGVRAGLECVERGSLTAYMRVCPRARRRVCGILRPVLRSTLRPVLQGIFRATLRNQEIRGFRVGAKVVRTRLEVRGGAGSRQPPELS